MSCHNSSGAKSSHVWTEPPRDVNARCCAILCAIMRAMLPGSRKKERKKNRRKPPSPFSLPLPPPTSHTQVVRDLASMLLVMLYSMWYVMFRAMLQAMLAQCWARLFSWCARCWFFPPSLTHYDHTILPCSFICGSEASGLSIGVRFSLKVIQRREKVIFCQGVLSVPRQDLYLSLASDNEKNLRFVAWSKVSFISESRKRNDDI